MKHHLDREALVARLERLEYKPPKSGDEEEAVELGLGESLLTLTGIKNEQEWQLCREVALHLIGAVPEPDDDDDDDA